MALRALGGRAAYDDLHELEECLASSRRRQRPQTPCAVAGRTSSTTTSGRVLDRVEGHRGMDEGRRMRILMVSPYPPVRDGIAAYAVQDVAALRRQGHEVEVLSPYLPPRTTTSTCAAPGALRPSLSGFGYDKVIVQFHPDFFFPVSLTDGQRVATALALGAAFRLARVVEVIVHEVDYRMGEGTSAVARAMRQLWRSPDRIMLHTEDERDQFLEAFGIDPSRLVLLEHGRSFNRTPSMIDIRPVPPSLLTPTPPFSCPSGSFSRTRGSIGGGLCAFRGLDERGAQLYVVGSLRVEDAAYVTYVEDLQTLIEQTPGAHLVEGFVSDEMFDRWLVAADALVLPYRHIWSSGVLERAHLYRVPVIVTDVGGLRHQVAGRDDVTVVSNDAALRDAMLERAGVAAAAEAAPWPTEGQHLMHDVQAAVETRAAQRRGGPVRAVALGSSLGGPGRASAPVRALHPLIPAAPNSHRPGATTAKRVITRSGGVDGGAGIRAGQRASAVDNPSARRNGPTASNFVDFRSLRRCCERPGSHAAVTPAEKRRRKPFVPATLARSRRHKPDAGLSRYRPRARTRLQ